MKSTYVWWGDRPAARSLNVVDAKFGSPTSNEKSPVLRGFLIGATKSGYWTDVLEDTYSSLVASVGQFPNECEERQVHGNHNRANRYTEKSDQNRLNQC